jgi:rod shape-determining protein MreD
MRSRFLALGKLALLLVLAVIFQAIVTSRVTILGVTSDVFLILVVLVGVSRGSVTGALFGFCAGLLADVVYLNPVGLRALIYLLAGYLCGRYAETAGPPSALVILALTAVVSFSAQTAYGLFQFLTGTSAAFFTMMRIQMLPAALLDGLLAVPVYLALTRLHLLSRADVADPSFRLR